DWKLHLWPDRERHLRLDCSDHFCVLLQSLADPSGCSVRAETNERDATEALDRFKKLNHAARIREEFAMNTRSTVLSMCLLLGMGIAGGGSAIAQGMMGGTGTGTMREGMMQGGMGMHGGMMGRGMMEGGMNCPMMGGADAGMSGVFGSRVVPKMN